MLQTMYIGSEEKTARERREHHGIRHFGGGWGCGVSPNWVEGEGSGAMLGRIIIMYHL